MPAKTSAGILLYRWRERALEVLLTHPGGPFYVRKDIGAWSIPKGEVEPSDESLLHSALREFEEETGFALTPESIVAAIALTPVKIKSGKTIHAWVIEGDADPALLKSNLFRIEFPPKSGKMVAYPESDRAAWFGLEEARKRIGAGQLPLLEEFGKLSTNSSR